MSESDHFLTLRCCAAALAAGTVSGLLGGAGGMLLVPGLQLAGLEREQVFSASVAVMLPVCALSLAITATTGPLPLRESLPYLLGSAAGGLAAGMLRSRLPRLLLHRSFGVLLLLGGARFLLPW